MMRVCVFGAGSLGSAIGGMLAEKNEVTLIGRDPHMATVRREGLTLLGDVRRKVRVDARKTVRGIEPPDLILVSTKAFDTEEVITICASWAGEQTRVLTLQNGLANLDMLRAWKKNNALGGTTTLGARLVEPGRVRVSGLGKTIVGGDIDPAFAAEVASAFTASGMPTRVTSDIRKEIWTKATISACINPLTAILRVGNGSLCQSEAVARLVAEVCRECSRVAGAEGIRLGAKSLERRVWEVAEDTSKNWSSMLQDVESRKRTEIEQINGAFCEMAARHGLPAPINRALTAMVSALDARRPMGKV